MRNYRFLSFSVVTSIVIVLLRETSYAANAISYSKWGFECGVTVMDPHISTSLQQKGGGRNIKIDAYSKCELLQRNVILTVELYKRGLLNPIFIANTSTDPTAGKSTGYVVNNFGTFKQCISNKPSRFWGRAKGIAMINGKRYSTPWVQSGVTKGIACGT